MTDRTVSVRLRAVTDQFERAMRGAANSMGQIEANSERLSRTGRQLTTRVTAPLMGVAGAATAVGMQYESAMLGVQAVTGETGESLDNMAATAREMGSTTQFSASQAAGALEFLGMAGFSAEEATAALPDTLNLAAAGGMELAQSADLASNVLNQFALDVDDTGRVADVLAQTSRNANTSVEQMGQAMQMAGPVANAAGLEIEETAAVIGAMGDAGIQASTAGTSLRQTMTQLLNASGPAADTLERLGIEAQTSSGELRPMADIIDDLGAAGATAGDLMEIFGQRAGPAMAALVNQGGDALRDLEDTIRDSGGAAEEMAETRMQGLEGSLRELRSAAEEAGITLFEAGIGDALEGIADGAADALRWVSDLPDPLLNTGIALGGIAAASGPAMSALGLLGRVYRPVIDRTRNLSTSMQVLGQEATGASSNMRAFGRAVGVAGAVWAAGEAVDFLGDQIHDLVHGPLADVDDMLLAMEGLARAGEAPASVGDALDGIGDAFDRHDVPGWADTLMGVQQGLLDIPVAGQAARIFAPGMAEDVREWERASDEIDAFDQALARAVESGNDAAVRAGLQQLGEQVGLSGDALDEFARDNLDAYARAVDRADMETDEFQTRLAQTDAIREFGSHMERMPGAAGAAADGMSDLADATDGAAEASERARDAMNAYLDDVRAATDPVFALHRALGDVEEAQSNYNDAVEEYGEGSREAEDAAMDLAGKIVDLERAALDGDLSFSEFEGQLQRWVDEGRITADEADVIRGRVDELTGSVREFEGDYLAELRADVGQVEGAIDALMDHLRGAGFTRGQAAGAARWTAQANVHFSTSGSTSIGNVASGQQVEFRAGGGRVEPGQPYVVGEDGPEMVTFDQPGMVHDAATTRQLLEPSPRADTLMHPATSAGGMSTVTVSVPVHLDGAEIGRSTAVVDALSGEVRSRQLASAGAGPWG